MLKRLILPACLALGLVALGRPASADLTFHVNFNTSALNPISTYYAEFVLSDGSVVSPGVPDTNNSVTFSNFNLGSGVTGAALPPVGNASGSMASSVTLADGDAGGVADHAQAFTPGTFLSFDVTTTTNADGGGVPDSITFYLLDSGFNQLTTNGPVDTPNTFFRLDLTGPGVTLANVGAYGGPEVPAPTISAVAVTTPEPGAVALGISVAFGGSIGLLRRRRAAKR